MADNQSGSVEKRKLQDILQCPVCLTIPRQGPIVTECENGHFKCPTCPDNGSKLCPTCRGPLNPAKRVRNLLAEQIIEAAEFTHKCKHPTCDFSAQNRDLVSHESRCTLRLVPCPDDGCNVQIPLSGVLDHMRGVRERITRTTPAHVTEYDVPVEHFNNLVRDIPFLRHYITKCHGKIFIPAFTRKGNIYCAWMYILGNTEEARHFSVTISIGEGTASGIFKVGRIFPIDVKMEDIIKEQNGVLRYNQDPESFFTDQRPGMKSIRINYKIIRSSSTLPKLVLRDESEVNMDQAGPSSSRTDQTKDDVDRMLCDIIMKELNDGMHDDLIVKILSSNDTWVETKRHDCFVAKQCLIAGHSLQASLLRMLKTGHNDSFMVSSPGPRSTSFSHFVELKMRRNQHLMKLSETTKRDVDLMQEYQTYCVEPELLIQVILKIRRMRTIPRTINDSLFIDKLSKQIIEPTYDKAEAFYLKKRRRPRTQNANSSRSTT